MSVRGLLPAARCLSVNLGQDRGGGCRVTELKLQKLEFRPIITAFRITIMPALLYIEFSSWRIFRYTIHRFQGRQRWVYGESLLPVSRLSRVKFFRLALYYLTMFGMNMVKVIHEELILLLVLDFDDIWSPSRMECIYRRKCLIFRFTISSCSQGVHVPRVSMMSIKIQPHKRYEYILLKEWWSVSRLKSIVFRFKIWSSSL